MGGLSAGVARARSDTRSQGGTPYSSPATAASPPSPAAGETQHRQTRQPLSIVATSRAERSRHDPVQPLGAHAVPSAFVHAPNITAATATATPMGCMTDL